MGVLGNSVAAAARNLLDWQAGFEVRRVVGNMLLHSLRCHQFIHKALVLRFRQRAIQVIARAIERLIVARRGKRNGAVDRLRIHNRADAVVEKQPVSSRDPRDFRGQGIRGQRTAGNHPGLLRIKRGHLLAPEFNEPRLSRNLRLVELLREIGLPHGISPGVVAVAWTLHHPAITAAIVGGRSAKQIEGVIPAETFRLSDEEFSEIQGYLAQHVQ